MVEQAERTLVAPHVYVGSACTITPTNSASLRRHRPSLTAAVYSAMVVATATSLAAGAGPADSPTHNHDHIHMHIHCVGAAHIHISGSVEASTGTSELPLRITLTG